MTPPNLISSKRSAPHGNDDLTFMPHTSLSTKPHSAPELQQAQRAADDRVPLHAQLQRLHAHGVALRGQVPRQRLHGRDHAAAALQLHRVREQRVQALQAIPARGTRSTSVCKLAAAHALRCCCCCRQDNAAPLCARPLGAGAAKRTCARHTRHDQSVRQLMQLMPVANARLSVKEQLL